jgi:proteasome assembly chaperone (PAC2) family protein
MERRGNIILTEKPALRKPYLICGISGWVDGGQAATGTVEYLLDKTGAEPFAEIPIDRFHVFQVPGQISSRPHVKIEEGLLTEHEYPENEFFYARIPHSQHDLILFLGTEPSLHWEEYADAILYIIREFGVVRTFLLGGVLDKTPHTREPNVSCSCTSADLRDEMRKYGVLFGNYEGPGRFGTTLLHTCMEYGLPLVSLTARATYYPEFSIVISPNPKTIRAIVTRLSAIMRLEIDTSDLDTRSDEFEERLAGMAGRSDEFRNYVEKLEKDYSEVRYEEPLGLSGDEAVQIAEELLKGNNED